MEVTFAAMGIIKGQFPSMAGWMTMYPVVTVAYPIAVYSSIYGHRMIIHLVSGSP